MHVSIPIVFILSLLITKINFDFQYKIILILLSILFIYY